MNPIQYQAIEFWQNLIDKDTAWTLKQGLEKFWELLKQAARLVYLLVLLSFAFFVWFWGVGFQSGRAFRVWLEKDITSPEDLLNRLINLLVKPLEALPDWASSTIKELLGIETKVLPPAKEAKALPQIRENQVSIAVKSELVHDETSSLTQK